MDKRFEGSDRDSGDHSRKSACQSAALVAPHTKCSSPYLSALVLSVIREFRAVMTMQVHQHTPWAPKPAARCKGTVYRYGPVGKYRTGVWNGHAFSNVIML